MKHILLITCLFRFSVAIAQTDTINESSQIFGCMGGQEPTPKFDLPAYLHKNLRYPSEAKQKKIEGRVIVKFFVDENGKVGDVIIVRGIGGGCDQEAERVVKLMPRWKPGMQNAKVVRAYCMLPIQFTLN